MQAQSSMVRDLISAEDVEWLGHMPRRLLSCIGQLVVLADFYDSPDIVDSIKRDLRLSGSVEGWKTSALVDAMQGRPDFMPMEEREMSAAALGPRREPEPKREPKL